MVSKGGVSEVVGQTWRGCDALEGGTVRPYVKPTGREERVKLQAESVWG